MLKRYQRSKINSALQATHGNITVTDTEAELLDDYLFDSSQVIKYTNYKPKGIVANKIIGSFVGAVIGLALFSVIGPLGFQLGIVIGGLIGSLFERKKKPKEDSKFSPEAQFNQELAVAKYGDPVAMIFCNRDENNYGGVRVSGNLINARVTNVRGEEFIKMLFVVGLGELGSATHDPYDLTGFKFGDEKIDLTTNDDVTVKTTRGTALQDSFNNEFPYASQVKTPEQNKSCSSKFILALPYDTYGGNAIPSTFSLAWTNLPANAINPVADPLGNGFQSQLAPADYYKLINIANDGVITATYTMPDVIGSGVATVATIFKENCVFGIKGNGVLNYFIDFRLDAGIQKARLSTNYGTGGQRTIFDNVVDGREFFIRVTAESQSYVYHLESGYKNSISVQNSQETVLHTITITGSYNTFKVTYDYSLNPLIIAGNTTPINWVIGASGNISASTGTQYTTVKLNQELIGAIGYGVDYVLYQPNIDTESQWFQFTSIDTINFTGITTGTTNFSKGALMYSMSQFLYETTKPCDIVEINMFGVIWSRNKKTNELTYDTQMFDVYVNVNPNGDYYKVQRFFISSNNTSGIKRQIRLEFNNKNYRSIKIRPIISAKGDSDIRKIEPRDGETIIQRIVGSYDVKIKFQEDQISLNSAVPEDPFNPRPPTDPVPTWLTSYLSIFRQAIYFAHSSETADPLVINSINEVANYPPDFDGTYPNYAMYSVITKSSVRTNPVNPSIVVTRGILAKRITGIARLVTKESPMVVLNSSSDFLSTDTVYCPRIDLIITPSAMTADTITLANATVILLSVGDVLITYRMDNVSRYPDVFNHVLTDANYLGDIVNNLLIDYASIVEAKDFVILRNYFYDFAQVQSVSFQQWALANAAFNLLLPKKSGGKYGLMSIVREGIEEMFSNYNILLDSYAESSVPYKDTEIDNLGVKTIDGRENRYRERQVGVIRNTNFNYSFVIEAQSITREQQGKDFAVYSMNSRVKQNSVVEIATDWEGGRISVGGLVYILREENLYDKESSGIIIAVDGLANTITVSNYSAGAVKLLVFTRASKQFIEYDISAASDDIITLIDVSMLSVGDTFILGDEKLITHRFIIQNKSMDVETNQCKLTGVNYPDDLESLEGLTVYSDYFNAITLSGSVF